MGCRKKTSMTRGGLQGSITRQPSSRAADEDTTVCLSCQHWGELGICQLYIPSLIQARRPRQSATQAAAHPSLHPHSLPCTLGEQVAAHGDFSTGAFDHSEPRRAEPIFTSAASWAVLSCAPDVPQWQQSQKGTLRSRSKAGVGWLRLHSQGWRSERSFTKSLSSALICLFSFKYQPRYEASSRISFGLKEPLSLSWWKLWISIAFTVKYQMWSGKQCAL